MTKYDGINVGLSTGTPQITVPLYTLATKNILVPLELNYASNGIRVDEIASRTGMTWVLNGGGVISRIVNDDPDEKSTKLNIPNDFTQLNKELLNYLDAASNTNNDGLDISPDIFSYNFNGHHGKFILNGTSVVQLQKSSLKIEWLSGTFRITEPNGTTYSFGDFNATESSKNNSIGTESCAKNYNDFVTTGWYLSKIKHPAGDSVMFSYQTILPYSYATGVSQTAFGRLVLSNPCPNGRCPDMPSGECKSMATVNSIYLTDIKSSNKVQIRFTYTGRRDLPYDFLQDSVLIYLPEDAKVPFKSFKFRYTVSDVPASNSYSQEDVTLRVRPFLTQLSEFDKQQTTELKHNFQYDDINGMPSRLSFSQDHFGYSNGAGNSQFLPSPKEADYKNLFPQANANREPNDYEARRGMLTKITYPSSGYDSLVYTGVTVYTEEKGAPRNVTESAATAGYDFSMPITKYSDTILIESLQSALVGASYFFGGNPDDEDFHKQSLVSLIRLSDNKEIFYETMNHDNPTRTEYVWLYPNTKYILKITSYGENANGQIVLHYQIPNNDTIRYNKPTGGVVLDKVLTVDPVVKKTKVKKFFYAKLADLTRSSGNYLFSPIYTNKYTAGIDCGIQCTGLCEYVQLSSNSLVNQYLYSGTNISYSSVIESFGENFEGGGIEHQFIVSPDVPGELKMGNDLISSPLTNSGYMNGKETLQHAFIRNGNTNVSVKKIVTSYYEDPRLSELYSGYTVYKKYDPKCKSNPPAYSEFQAFDVKKHLIFCKWVFVNGITTTVFDSNGGNGVTTSESYSYGNLSHLLPTRKETVNSRDEKEVTVSKYPQDVDRATLPATAAAAVNDLINNNILDPVLTEEKYNETTLLTRKVSHYRNWGSNIVKPERIFFQLQQGPLEERLSYYSYDNRGDILEQAKTGDMREVFLWGYNNEYPVAKIVGSTYAAVAALVNMSVLNSPVSDQQLRDEINKIRQNFGTGIVKVSTYTYRPGLGLTSETNPAGLITYYEYDSFGRLRLVRDHNQKILKLYDYQYLQPITQ
ncbi:MAG TPA: hypothetical protein VM802_06145 [Chitinophaga sp.]|uniref:hypothetical protein n=1 Tax=Chitinophaga sp. TaxID=1869181 RepID=UPI002BA232DC|nr:hypothetical protein [Chitinophaga sp.]HVI44427.1 hypothetical protein [Chitinophaga sp.]